jgi:polyhydroxyalkanoate synthesis repressor PhaR
MTTTTCSKKAAPMMPNSKGGFDQTVGYVGVPMTLSVDPVTIKKYGNRRLYNTTTSAYENVESLAGMAKRGDDFVVYDARSGDDITRSVLRQIVAEEEKKSGQDLLPIAFMRGLIGFYGGSMQEFVPGYLEQSMKALTREREERQG